MSKETIKLYSPNTDKGIIEVVEITEDAYKGNEQAYSDLGLFETYPKAKEQLDFELKVQKIIDKLAIPNCDDKIEAIRNDIKVLKKLDKHYGERFELIDIEQVHLSERIEQLNRKLNGKDNRVDALSDKIDNIKNESKRGQDLLLDRIKELESELEPDNVNEGEIDIRGIISALILILVFGTIIAFGIHSVVN